MATVPSCPKCKSNHWIELNGLRICVPCGRRVTEEQIQELAQDYAEGEVKEEVSHDL